jgi:hypothetical protein
MKGHRPGGKHDTPVTRSGDERAKLSGVDEIALRALRHQKEQAAKARQHREEQKARSHQKRLSEIKNILRRLQRCCWRRQDELLWPDENDLKRLDVLVSELVGRIRKRRGLPRWKRYKAVDDHWHLRLWQTLSDLVDRAASNAPRRPLEDYDQALTNGSFREATKRFFWYYGEVLSGRRDPSQIKWEEFDELFTSVTGKYISRAVPLTSAKSVAYTVFLELFCADQLWVTKHRKDAWRLTLWIATCLQHPQMLRKLTRFFIPSERSFLIKYVEQLPKRLAEEKKRTERARDSARKHRK